jgi:hypothetical protein
MSCGVYHTGPGAIMAEECSWRWREIFAEGNGSHERVPLSPNRASSNHTQYGASNRDGRRNTPESYAKEIGHGARPAEWHSVMNLLSNRQLQ